MEIASWTLDELVTSGTAEVEVEIAAWVLSEGGAIVTMVVSIISALAMY